MQTQHRRNWNKRPVKAATARAEFLEEVKPEVSIEGGQVRTAGLAWGVDPHAKCQDGRNCVFWNGAAGLAGDRALGPEVTSPCLPLPSFAFCCLRPAAALCGVLLARPVLSTPGCHGSRVSCCFWASLASKRPHVAAPSACPFSGKLRSCRLSTLSLLWRWVA